VVCLVVLVAGGLVMLPDFLPDDITDITGTTSSTQTIVDVENQMDVDICGIYISYASSTEWGDNLLTSGQTIPPSNYVSFYVNVGETIDILATDCSGYEIDSLFDVYVPAEGLTVSYSPTQ